MPRSGRRETREEEDAPPAMPAMRIERRGRPRKEVHRGDADGVRKHLTALSERFPEVRLGGEEASRPRSGRGEAVEEEAGASEREEEEEEEEESIEESIEESVGRVLEKTAMSVRASAAKVGTRRSVESRKKIAKAQRERWRKARLEAEAEAPPATAEPFIAETTTRPVKSGKSSASASERTARLTKLIAIKKSTSRSEKIASSSVKVNQFSSELSQYTRLRNELASWSEGFEESKGRRPTLKDVQNTRIPWLIESFQEYVRLRNKLIAEAPNVRGEVGKIAKQTLPSPRSLPSGQITLSIDDDADDDDLKGDKFSVFNFK